MSPEDIAAIRDFNRTYTRWVGVLDESYLARGRPLAEARLIFEIGSGAVPVKGLRGRLGLDSGYLSRLLASLERQGLARVTSDPSDRRGRAVKLTAKGRAERQAYDRLSDAQVGGLLARLAPADAARLVTSLSDALRMLRKASVVVTEEDPRGGPAMRCLEQYYAELDRRFDGGFDPSAKAYAGRPAVSGRQPSFLVAWIDGVPVGCGGLYPGEDGMGEIKRMWVSPEARGLGIARRLLAELEARASVMGLHALRLDTNRVLAEAQALYKSAGYSEIARYSDNPYAHRWFGKPLKTL